MSLKKNVKIQKQCTRTASLFSITRYSIYGSMFYVVVLVDTLTRSDADVRMYVDVIGPEGLTCQLNNSDPDVHSNSGHGH